MPAHPERLAAFAVAGALALSLLLGVAWRDQIACGLVEASGLTMIGPKIFADAPVDAQESALLLDRARESRARAAAAHDQSSDEAVLIFSDSNFWRGDADARVIRTPFRACVVIGPQARGIDRIASELARVGPARREALKAPSLASEPAAGAGQTATAAKPSEIEHPASPPAAETSTAAPALAPAPSTSPPPLAAPARKAPDSSVAGAPDSTAKATQPVIAPPTAPPPESQAPAPASSEARAPSSPQTAPVRQPGSSQATAPAQSAPANAGASPPRTAATEPAAPQAPSSEAPAPTPSAPKGVPAPRASASSTGPRPMPLTPRAPTHGEVASSFSAPQGALTPRLRMRPGQPIRASLPTWNAPLAARHIRPTQARAARPPAAPSLAPASPIAPPRAAQRFAPTPPAHPNPFAAPSLWDAWARRDPLATAPSLRRMDRFGGVLYQARDLRNGTLCSTGSTNGYCRCRRASMRRWR